MPEKMKRPKKHAPADVRIPSRLGGGVLKERVIRDLPSKKVASYALAYINPLIFSGDNGRVLGYETENRHDEGKDHAGRLRQEH